MLTQKNTSQEGTQPAFNLKKVLCFVLLGLFAAWLFLRLFAPLLVSGFYELGGELADYKRTLCVGWEAEEPYAVFPDKELVEGSVHYSYELYSEEFPILFLLYDNDAAAALCCTYTAQDYEEEIQRLKQLCGEPDETHFASSAYVYHTEHRGLFVEYALFDSQSRTIRYFALQGLVYSKKYVDPAFLPLNWNKH